MRKIYIIIFLLSLQFALSAQWYGDGSEGDAFWGVINSSYPLDTELEWNTDNFPGGVIYVGQSGSGENDLVIGSGYTLTIGPGITVILTQLTSDLIITGSGILTAEGTSSNQIIFTKASGNSHWGHISFETPGSGTPIAGTGTFDYCIIEYGYAATSGTYPSNAGGGIQVNANDVTIENCYFEYNYSNFGGAVTVNAGRNTEIKNCVFKSNTSYQAGGALLLWTSSTAKVENCIFEENNSLSNGGTAYGGGGIWILANTSTIVNCTFVNNTATDPGDAIYSYSSSGSRIINCILWGSSNQFAGTYTANTIVNCAFETSKPSLAATSITISAVASDHFVDAGSSDWTLKFISPCRDAGINSYTGVTISSTDYDGNPRIGTKDIGTYEVQYSRWLTSPADNTSWSNTGNWEEELQPGVSTGDVVIPALANSTVAPDISGTTTISSGKYLLMEPGAKATFGTLSNSGTLRLESDADSIASLIVSTYSDSGNEEIELYLTGGSSPDYKWHYISSPVSSLATSVFTGTTNNLAQYVESLPVSDSPYDLLRGWIAYDTWSYYSGSLSGSNGFSTLDPGKGYNYYYTSNKTYSFSGTLNTSDVSPTLGYSGVDASMSGFNLLGNPFSSGLDWDDIADGVHYSYPASTSKGLYFTRNNTQCSYISGVGIPLGVTGIIPPMQGFFVHTTAVGGTSLTLPAEARTHNDIHARYKGKTLIPLVRLSVTEDTISNDETVVRFDEFAKSYLDNDFDAIKMFLSSTKTTIHTSLDGTDYAINGLPFPETVVEIPVVVNVVSDGNHKISAMQLQGLEDYNVILTDNSTGYIADLKTNPDLIFYSPEGLLSDRFVLKVSNVATVVEPSLIIKSDFNLFYGFDLINIQTLSGDWEGKYGSVRVMDMAGKTITNLAGTEFSRNSLTQIRAPKAKGLYLVEIKAGVKKYVGKVVIR